MFLDQMKKFIEWVQNTEEGERDSGYTGKANTLARIK
jgi:hypothetical protein